MPRAPLGQGYLFYPLGPCEGKRTDQFVEEGDKCAPVKLRLPRPDVALNPLKLGNESPAVYIGAGLALAVLFIGVDWAQGVLRRETKPLWQDIKSRSTKTNEHQYGLIGDPIPFRDGWFGGPKIFTQNEMRKIVAALDAAAIGRMLPDLLSNRDSMTAWASLVRNGYVESLVDGAARLTKKGRIYREQLRD